MKLLKLAVLSLIRRPARHVLLFILLTVSCAFPVFIIQLASGLYGGINRAAEPFPIIAGAQGSSYQLVLNTVFLRDRPLGNIPYEKVEELRESGKVRQVIPLAFGDNYRGFHIIGTEADAFQYRPNPGKEPWLTVAEGHAFQNHGEAVVGSETARLTGLRLGDTFTSIHGLAGSGKGHARDHPFRVAGILKPVGGPYDTAVLVNIKDVWEAHGGGRSDADENIREGKPEAEGNGDVTAVLIQPRGYKEAMQLMSRYQNRRDGMQLVFPSQSVIALYSMVGQSRQFWEIITAALIAAAVMVTCLVSYWNGLSRMKEWALLKALGGSSKTVFRLIFMENIFLLTAGALSGWGIGYGGSLAAAHGTASQTAVVMDPSVQWIGWIPPLVSIAAGIAGSTVPAWLIRKKDISPYL